MGSSDCWNPGPRVRRWEERSMRTVSIIVPAFNEVENLRPFYERLCATMQSCKLDWEWIIVDDHSCDETYAAASSLGEHDPRVRVIRLARNSGSHIAIACGLRHARSDCAVIMAVDLQDPPEMIPALVEKWREGSQVVWAARRRREGEKTGTIALSRIYYAIMRHLVGMKEMPSRGADFVLVDRRVIDALGQFNERNISIMALITWLGFEQTVIAYDKKARLHGESGWDLQKKLKLAVDSITAFSYFPIRLMSLLGIIFAACGVCWAVVVVVGRLCGYIVAGTGYAAIMTVLLLGFGFLMTFLGVLGEYLWRTLDEARGRPRCIIERTVNLDGDDPTGIPSLVSDASVDRRCVERRAAPEATSIPIG
ncbi:MAG: glycosyltransferase family 2 protein [Planctomycetes bacterium]|nr:glycosyltransferase family 2 protein [Planctomycetota bacterium]